MVWLVFLVIAVPLIGILVWLLLDESFVRIAPGRLGLLLVRGMATDKTLGPGVHWVPALRRRTVEEYPSLELSYRAGDIWSGEADDDDLERGGPDLRLTLGDRTRLTVAYTVRFRLDLGALKMVHNRFGTDGIWAAVRDGSGRAMRNAMGDAQVRIDDLFGDARRALETELARAVSEALAADGFIVTMYTLGDLDLGRTGEVIQSTVRARLELEREEAEAAMRVARARIDSQLGPYTDAGSNEVGLRYREVDAWRDIAPALGPVQGAAVSAARGARPAPEPPSTRPEPVRDALAEPNPDENGR